ncbi:Segregation and condensation protein A [Peptoniphilus sp. ING2-D1G]|nr:Segregation and condensation protein A [Peptoniphilus sp. ING2-D1G]
MEYNISLKVYEGPMDLLIDLIKKNNIDIFDIPIHLITNQFIEYIENSKKLNMELTSDFILMASTLLEIKSRMLLPKFSFEEESEEEAEDPRQDLVNKILEYEKYKEISEKLKESSQYEQKSFYKLQEDFSDIKGTDFIDDIELTDLARAFNNIIKRYKTRNAVESIVSDEYTVDVAMEQIMTLLEGNSHVKFTQLLSEYPLLEEIIIYFLSLLELIRMGKIKAHQQEDFSDIVIVRRENAK